jgi:hypothetical protein
LLFEGQLFLRVVGWARPGRAHHVLVSSKPCSRLLLHLLHLLHLHLLHHGGVHLGLRIGAAILAIHAAHHVLHLLHHCWVHLGPHATHGHGILHAALLLRSNLLLHLLKVLLHTLPVLGHHGWAHSLGVASASLLILLLIIEASSAVVAIPEFATAAKLLVLFLAHVAAGLCTLDFNRLSEDLQRSLEGSVDSSVPVKGDEAKTARAARIFIHHQGSIHDAAELLEEVLEVILCGFLADPTDEDLACPFLLLTGDGALRIDLGTRVRRAMKRTFGAPTILPSR